MYVFLISNRTNGAGNVYPSGTPEFTPRFSGGSLYSIFSCICMFCRSLIIDLIFVTQNVSCVLKEFEDTEWVIRIRKSKKNRQHNGQEKKNKRTNNDLQNIHIQLKIEYS
jgi:hypothetical protein